MSIVRVSDFQAQVVERSGVVPVVADFWAEWCGPCKVLGPVLERLAGRADGAWDLATIDTEELPEVAERFGIRSIPHVKLFVDGRPTDEFTGALPEHLVARWLDSALPRPNRAVIAKASLLASAGRKDDAVRILEELVSGQPDDPDGREALARLIALSDADRAAGLVSGLERVEHQETVAAVATLKRLHDLAAGKLQAPPGPSAAAYLEAAKMLFGGNAAGALDNLIALVRQDRAYDDDGARKAVVAVFHCLGDDNPDVMSRRRDFAGALNP